MNGSDSLRRDFFQFARDLCEAFSPDGRPQVTVPLGSQIRERRELADARIPLATFQAELLAENEVPSDEGGDALRLFCASGRCSEAFFFGSSTYDGLFRAAVFEAAARNHERHGRSAAAVRVRAIAVAILDESCKEAL